LIPFRAETEVSKASGERPAGSVRPRALDLFCGAGGVSMGLYRAGFDVVGIDINPQPRYPFDFIQGDAMQPPVNLADFDFIWASPPCQHYSQMTPKAHRDKHPDLIDATRRMLDGFVYCIENVPSAKRKLRSPAMLCGSMFGLRVQRHRFFETNFYLMTPQCRHTEAPVLITGTHRRTYEPRYEYSVAECREAADIPWMTRKELDQAIPPAYSEFIGRAALNHIRQVAA
jgi:DNA (cytosine-5)-methyltransferase 1